MTQYTSHIRQGCILVIGGKLNKGLCPPNASIFYANPMKFSIDNALRPWRTLSIQLFSLSTQGTFIWKQYNIWEIVELIIVTSLSPTTQNQEGAGLISIYNINTVYFLARFIPWTQTLQSPCQELSYVRRNCSASLYQRIFENECSITDTEGAEEVWACTSD